ncbi:Sterol 3-beta-glucosyltransferase [Linnemannia zychae]|nr:Sterol 3-beta-glucosyltransferase [Linnemannia zychae]
MVFTDKLSLPPTSGPALLQLLAAAFRSGVDDSDSDSETESSQQNDQNNVQQDIRDNNNETSLQSPDDASSISEVSCTDTDPGPTCRSIQGELAFGTVEDKKGVANKLQATFGYPEDEQLMGEYSCWLARSLLLPGYLYITTRHVCFYANLPSNHDVVQKEGFFSKKSSTTTKFNRYWFILKNDVLSYYSDQSDVYYPIKSISLENMLSAEPSLKDSLVFYIHTPTRRIKFKTDSELGRAEWVKAIQKSIFHAKMDRDNVKISIPLSYITAVGINPTSFVDTIQIAVRDSDGTDDEFFFTHFKDVQEPLTLLRRQVNETKNGGSEEHLKFFNNTSPASNGGQRSLQDELPHGPLAASISGSNQQSSTVGTTSKMNPLHYFHTTSASDGNEPNSSNFLPFSFGTTSTTNDQSSGQKSYDEDNMGSGFKEQDTFRKEFSLPEGESIGAIVPGYLLRYLPLYGKIYLSDNYVCFRSTVYGFSTKVIVPLSDVVHVDKHHGTHFYFHGLSLSTKKEEEIFLEFSSRSTRNSILVDIRDRITPEAQERRKEHRAQAIVNSPSVQLDDPMESRVLDSLQFQDQSMSLAAHPGYKPSRPFHITCLTIGSRGDVQPYIAFCKRLMDDGHTCRIATHSEYKDWIESHGIEYGYVGGTDVLIESPSAMVGIHIADALVIPYFRAFPFPWTRTRSFPHPFAVAERNLGRGYNYMTFVMMDQVLWKGISGQINQWRKKRLGLAPTTLEKMEAHRVPCLYSWSPSLVPAPMDWHSWVHVTGYWFLDNPHLDWSPPNGLEEFLEADPANKPIYIGFGSMIVSDPEEMTKTIVDSVIQAGVRAIISKGWSDKLSSSETDGPVAVVKKEGTYNNNYTKQEKEKVYPSNIYMLKSVPHDWLFPRLAGVVHHGGAGTTAAGLRAGIPIVIKPYFGDQYFWAQRVEEAGAGVWCHDLTVKKLSSALKTITTDAKMIAKAKLIGERIRAEDGVGTAVHYFYHDLPIADERLKARQEVKNVYNNLVSHLMDEDNEDKVVDDLSVSNSDSTNNGTMVAPLQHAVSIQSDGHPPPKGINPSQQPLRDHLKPSTAKPDPDHSLVSINNSDKSIEDLAANFHAIHLAHNVQLATRHINEPDKSGERSDKSDKADSKDNEPPSVSTGETKKPKEKQQNEDEDENSDSDSNDSEDEKKIITIDNRKPSKMRRTIGSVKTKMSRVKSYFKPSPSKNSRVEGESQSHLKATRSKDSSDNSISNNNNNHKESAS